MKRSEISRNKKRIMEMLDIVMKVNRLESRELEKTGNLPTAFFEFKGHVGQVQITFYPEGWGSGSGSESYEVSIEEPITDETMEKIYKRSQELMSKYGAELIRKMLLKQQEEVDYQYSILKSLQKTYAETMESLNGKNGGKDPDQDELF